MTPDQAQADALVADVRFNEAIGARRHAEAVLADRKAVLTDAVAAADAAEKGQAEAQLTVHMAVSREREELARADAAWRVVNAFKLRGVA